MQFSAGRHRAKHEVQHGTRQRGVWRESGVIPAKHFIQGQLGDGKVTSIAIQLFTAEIYTWLPCGCVHFRITAGIVNKHTYIKQYK